MAKPKLSRKTTENRTVKVDLDAKTPVVFELSFTKIFPNKHNHGTANKHFRAVH